MSNDHNPLPRGMRINNPGNLRSAVGPDFKTVTVEGFASFATVEQGTRSLFYLIDQYYRHIGCTTLKTFVARYAPASENDVAAYELAMIRKLGLNPLKTATNDLLLTQPWRALDFARALIHVEQGPVTVGFASTNEWVSPSVMIEAMRNTGKWPL